MSVSLIKRLTSQDQTTREFVKTVISFSSNHNFEVEETDAFPAQDFYLVGSPILALNFKLKWE